MVQKNEKKDNVSDLNDSQQAIIASLPLPAENKCKREKRELVVAVLYLVDNWCWHNLPHGLPPYTTAANFYYSAIKSRLWEKIHTAMTESKERKRHVRFILPISMAQN